MICSMSVIVGTTGCSRYGFHEPWCFCLDVDVSRMSMHHHSCEESTAPPLNRHMFF